VLAALTSVKMPGRPIDSDPAPVFVHPLSPGNSTGIHVALSPEPPAPVPLRAVQSRAVDQPGIDGGRFVHPPQCARPNELPVVDVVGLLLCRMNTDDATEQDARLVISASLVPMDCISPSSRRSHVAP
jgi:hypothetical protein